MTAVAGGAVNLPDWTNTMRGDEAFEDNALIGQFAEEAVAAYFEVSGFSMTRFGVEHLFPRWCGEFVEDRHASARSRTELKAFVQQQEFVRFLRHHPDFVAVRKEPNEAGVRGIFPVEVKFRTERVFRGKRSDLTAVRLSQESVDYYDKYWNFTLIVVVCCKARTAIATRAHKLSKIPDGRVPFAMSEWRRSWFYDVTGSDFRPIWDFSNGYFDEGLGRAMVTEVVEWAETVRCGGGLVAQRPG